MRSTVAAALAAAFAVAGTPSAHASFHQMQIEQVIAGVNGDVERQAIQLRMREPAQGQVFNGELRAYDANGENPVVLLSFPAAVDNAATGDRILIATAKPLTDPALLPDFLLDAVIPESYLDAGRLTFETHGGLVYWSICWGGADYTGPTFGAATNTDLADGEFGPCIDAPLAARSRQAVLFDGLATDFSTGNANDYVTTTGAATFTNNAGESADVTDSVVYADGFDR